MLSLNLVGQIIVSLKKEDVINLLLSLKYSIEDFNYLLSIHFPNHALRKYYKIQKQYYINYTSIGVCERSWYTVQNIEGEIIPVLHGTQVFFKLGCLTYLKDSTMDYTKFYRYKCIYKDGILL